MPRVEARNLESATAQLVHQPWRHRTRFNADAGLVSAVSPYSQLNLFRVRGTLTTP